MLDSPRSCDSKDGVTVKCHNYIFLWNWLSRRGLARGVEVLWGQQIPGRGSRIGRLLLKIKDDDDGTCLASISPYQLFFYINKQLPADASAIGLQRARMECQLGIGRVDSWKSMYLEQGDVDCPYLK